MGQNQILISQEDRPWWQRILAAFFFTATVIFLLNSLSFFNIHNHQMMNSSMATLKLAILSFSVGVGFSGTQEHHFDLEERRFKTLFCVGVIKLGKWKPFENLEYISVFRNDSKGIFEINLWYNRNKRFNISVYDEEEDALFFGKEVAQKLSVGLLDATDPYNSKWVID
jgi:hypothetical protein